jgi:pantoate--beta-alanine ligase
MKVVESVRDLQDQIKQARAQGKKVGFVPTMGSLHQGHMMLVDQAVKDCDFVVCSIFINPLQFNDIDDLGRYPKSFDADRKLLIERHCDLLFFPSFDEMYPHGQDAQSTVSVPVVSEGLCGDSRPGHFDGMATVVMKLFHMVAPDVTFFGEKDFQQLAVIRKMIGDLNLPFEAIGVATCREDNGLAMSSRNHLLSPEEKAKASNIYRILTDISDAIKSGKRNFLELCENGNTELAGLGFEPDYLEVRNADTLAPALESDKDLVVLVAAILGKARLIDNLRIKLS